MEGGAIGDESQALADLQVMATMRLCEEFEAHTGKKVLAGSTFREHGEIARQFGYAATACPSGRYKRFYEAWANRDRPVVVAAESGDRVAKLEQKLTALEALTATWRESIAVGTYLRLTARICSPKPGITLSAIARVASGVTSRGAGPVPPVVRIRLQCFSSVREIKVLFMRSNSSAMSRVSSRQAGEAMALESHSFSAGMPSSL